MKIEEHLERYVQASWSATIPAHFLAAFRDGFEIEALA
jgi:hypothetical protein